MPELQTVLGGASVVSFALAAALAARAAHAYVRLDIRSVARSLAVRSRDGEGVLDVPHAGARRGRRVSDRARRGSAQVQVDGVPLAGSRPSDAEDLVLTELADAEAPLETRADPDGETTFEQLEPDDLMDVDRTMTTVEGE